MTLPPNPDLMRIFDFTAADLETNRAGRLSERQTEMLIAQAHQKRWHILIASFIVPIVLIGILIIGIPQIDPAHQTLGRVTSIGVALFLLVFMVLGVVDKESDIKQGKVDHVDGAIYIGIDHWLEGRGGYPKIGKYYKLDIALHGNRISKEIYVQLTQYLLENGTAHQFRAYYPHHSLNILSVEVVDR